MTIVGVGTDIVSLARVREARFLERVAEFVLRPEERDAMRKSRDSVQFLASRLAVKEAAIKAYPEPLGYHDVSVRRSGKGIAAEFPGKSPAYAAFASLAHEFEYAVGYVIVTHD